MLLLGHRSPGAEAGGPGAPRLERALPRPGSATAQRAPHPGAAGVRVQGAPCRPGLPGAKEPGTHHRSGCPRTGQAVSYGLRRPTHTLLGTAPGNTCSFFSSVLIFIEHLFLPAFLFSRAPIMCQHIVGPRDTGRTNRLLPLQGGTSQAPTLLSPPTAEQRPCSSW